MRKTLTALVAALFLILTPTAALAGSDGATPYQVTTVGVHLPAGDTFQAHGHVNVRYFDGDGIQRTAGVHFDPNNNQPGGAWIGESFIPWSAFGITEGSRITWVQVHGYNAHHGEGGQKPVPVGPKPDPSSETRTREEVETREVTQCPTEEAGYGTVTTLSVTVEISEQRTSTIAWDGADWVETWGEWTETAREDVHSETVQVREMTDAEYAECGLPATGAPLTAAAGMAVVLVLAGVGLAVARRRTETNR